MKFTAKAVDELMRDVSRFTEDRFKMHPAAPSLGHGTRYVDYNEQNVWTGGLGARQACAYFFGGAMGWAQATGREIPEDILRHLQSVYHHLNAAHGFSVQERAEWETRGRERAWKLATEEGLVAQGTSPSRTEGL